MRSESSQSATPATMGRVAGLLFLVGSVTTVVAILFPHSPRADVDAFWALAVFTALFAVVLLATCERLPAWPYQAVMVVGSLIVSLAIYFNGERLGGHAADNEVLYLWIALYAGYFFTRAQMAVQLLVIASCYAATLLLIHPGQVGFTRWFITVGMVSVAGCLVHVLRLRNDELVGELFAAARSDRLTGLLNRQGFEERFELELERARRTGQPVALVLADIDNFKELNDSGGHPAGDAALSAVGEIARRLTRQVDTMARIGGDEFAAVLPETYLQGAYDLASRLRSAVAEIETGRNEPVTMSFGIALCPTNGKTRDALVKAADRALYRAKELGRDRSVAEGLDTLDVRERVAS